jgi:hypothetical protein
MRNRGNMSPYTIYFARPPVSTFGNVLGHAYKTAKTEYGLRLAKVFLAEAKKLAPDRQITEEELMVVIGVGDEVFQAYADKPEEQQGTPDQFLHASLIELLQRNDVTLPKGYAPVQPEDFSLERLISGTRDNNIDEEEYEEIGDNFLWDTTDLPAYQGNLAVPYEGEDVEENMVSFLFFLLYKLQITVLYILKKPFLLPFFFKKPFLFLKKPFFLIRNLTPSQCLTCQMIKSLQQ